MNVQTLLLTGVAGFIGAQTAQKLLEAGHKVVGIDNMNDYYSPTLKQYRLKRLKQFSGFFFEEGDIENSQILNKTANQHRFDAVINLAARAGVRASIDDPHIYFSTNVNGTLNLLELMRREGIKKMVLASSSSLYAGHPLPFKEDASVNRPVSPYAASKKAAEVLAYSYKHLFDLDISVLRYFTVYGPAGRPDMGIFRFIKWIDEGTPVQLYGDGSQTRDFTYVDDIAEGTMLALKPLGYEIINLGGGKEPVSVKQIIEIIEQKLSKKAKIEYLPFHKADMSDTRADIEKARTLLDWQPKTDITSGLQKTVDWYLTEKALQGNLNF